MQADLQADVAIVGAGVMGAATAYWLTRLAPGLRVVLIERDFGYGRASSALSASSIRQQFSQPVNVALSAFGVEFLRGIGDHLEVDGERPAIGLVEAGYLYLADARSAPALRAAHATQVRLGAAIALLGPRALAERFAWLRTDDLVLGTHGEAGEGWFDGYALLTALVRKARAQGAVRLRGEVVRIDRTGGRIRAIGLADGRRLECGVLVNAAGPWAATVAALAGVELPVRARRRTVFVLSSPARLERCPLVVDPGGFWFRPDAGADAAPEADPSPGSDAGPRRAAGSGPGTGTGHRPPAGHARRVNHYIAGLEPNQVVPDSVLEDGPLEPQLERYDELWQALAHRVPAFEALRLERAWSGYYEMNLLDHNAVIGPHPELGNLYFINGFSGHGMQQAPGAGRGLAELIVQGRFTSLDLGALGFARIAAGQPLLEANVIG